MNHSRISRKRNSPVPSLEETPYTPGGHTLTVVPSQKDLVTNKLSWSPHISIIVAKANRMLGFLRRHCSTNVGTNQKRLLYLTFVRSHLDYASEVWAPQFCESELRLLEGIYKDARQEQFSDAVQTQTLAPATSHVSSL